MIEKAKRVSSLTSADLQSHPVWQYISLEENDETFVRPLQVVPAANLTNKVVGTKVTLANGQRVWAIIGNVDPTSARFTQHFLTLSVERDGQWFTLARYHDFDYSERGPETLARFLDLSVDEVFPIAYDIRSFAKGDATALSGQITKEPRERLSRAEIIAMAVP
jgi:hypothetical protein